MITVNAMGDPCPIPVVKTKTAIRNMQAPGEVRILVDNEISVQNLEKMAAQKHYPVKHGKLGEGQYEVIMTIGENSGRDTDDVPLPEACAVPEKNSAPVRKKRTVVAVSSGQMGNGDETLGGNLLKAFLYALSKQEELPAAVLFYNGGARMTCEGSPALEDLQSMAEEGVEILTCGTCLSFYGLTEKLKVGGITNMYDIVEKLTGADLVVKP